MEALSAEESLELDIILNQVMQYRGHVIKRLLQCLVTMSIEVQESPV
jgi:hypothetical protein